MRTKPTRSKYTPEQRSAAFWVKVDKDGPIPQYRPDLGPCWLWAASLNYAGYGQFWISGRMIFAHSFLIGLAPMGLQWDHLCRIRHCIRPNHLEPVTGRVNTLRGDTIASRNAMKSHCPKGHPYDENTWRDKKGRRGCRACARERMRTRS